MVQENNLRSGGIVGRTPFLYRIPTTVSKTQAAIEPFSFFSEACINGTGRAKESGSPRSFALISGRREITNSHRFPRLNSALYVNNLRAPPCLKYFIG